MTITGTGQASAQVTSSATGTRRLCFRRSNREVSYVYGVSQKAHDKLQRDRRMNSEGCPTLGPSPCRVGPKRSATRSTADWDADSVVLIIVRL